MHQPVSPICRSPTIRPYHALAARGGSLRLRGTEETTPRLRGTEVIFIEISSVFSVPRCAIPLCLQVVATFATACQEKEGRETMRQRHRYGVAWLLALVMTSAALAQKT